jgi:hypothetical protein
MLQCSADIVFGRRPLRAHRGPGQRLIRLRERQRRESDNSSDQKRLNDFHDFTSKRISTQTSVRMSGLRSQKIWPESIRARGRIRHVSARRASATLCIHGRTRYMEIQRRSASHASSTTDRPTPLATLASGAYGSTPSRQPMLTRQSCGPAIGMAALKPGTYDALYRTVSERSPDTKRCTRAALATYARYERAFQCSHHSPLECLLGSSPL